MSRAYRNVPLVLGPGKQGANCRRFGRVNCERLICQLDRDAKRKGVVLDLSAGGARLKFSRKPAYNDGDSGTIIIESETAPPLALGMRVIWRKKRGFRRYELGISFGEPPAQVRASLAHVMRSTSVTNTVYKENVA